MCYMITEIYIFTHRNENGADADCVYFVTDRKSVV